jgi:hypothetical protein
MSAHIFLGITLKEKKTEYNSRPLNDLVKMLETVSLAKAEIHKVSPIIIFGSPFPRRTYIIRLFVHRGQATGSS